MKWVKASERKSEHYVSVCCRVVGSEFWFTAYYDNSKGAYIPRNASSLMFHKPEETEWLDESPEPQEEITKYYHRGGGECVEPTMPTDPLTLKQFGNQFEQHIKGKPITAYCPPSLPVGWVEMDKVRVEWQQKYVEQPYWRTATKEEYDQIVNTKFKRIFLVPVEQEDETEVNACKHEALTDTTIGYYHCQMCNKSWTYNEWNDYKRYPSTPETFEQEAERLYPIRITQGPWGEVDFNLLERKAHIAARKMSQEELEAKDREIERLKGLLEKVTNPPVTPNDRLSEGLLGLF